jgi:hypothetical protein
VLAGHPLTAGAGRSNGDLLFAWTSGHRGWAIGGGCGTFCEKRRLRWTARRFGGFKKLRGGFQRKLEQDLKIGDSFFCSGFEQRCHNECWLACRSHHLTEWSTFWASFDLGGHDTYSNDKGFFHQLIQSVFTILKRAEKWSWRAWITTASTIGHWWVKGQWNEESVWEMPFHMTLHTEGGTFLNNHHDVLWSCIDFRNGMNNKESEGESTLCVRILVHPPQPKILYLWFDDNVRS